MRHGSPSAPTSTVRARRSASSPPQSPVASRAAVVLATRPMDLSHTPEEQAFRRQVRAWLKKNVPRTQRDERPLEWNDPARIAQAKAWQRKLYEAGYVALGWPREWGGQGMDVMRQT